MMQPGTISAQRPDGRKPRGRSNRAGRRFLLTAAAISIALHLAAALVIVYVPRILPRQPPPPEQGAVELLMVEKQGAKPSQAGPSQASKAAPPQPETRAETPKAAAAKPEAQAAASPSAPAPLSAPHGEEPVPPPAETTQPKQANPAEKPEAQTAATPPAPPAKQDPPVFDLAGTESESNAQVLGGNIIPASPDDRFRNRPPIYPYQAAVRGEHGSVVLLIHVSDAGFATGVDVMESSGVPVLDQAAEAAVRKWRFRPALHEGHAVPFDMPFRFIFQAN